MSERCVVLIVELLAKFTFFRDPWSRVLYDGVEQRPHNDVGQNYEERGARRMAETDGVHGGGLCRSS